MKQINVLFLIAAFSLASCSHSLMRGSVAMKTSANEAHVCLGDKEVKVGDRVSAYQNHCLGKGGGSERGAGITCEKRMLGEGTVTALINKHYSSVKFDDGVKFEEGTIVERR